MSLPRCIRIRTKFADMDAKRGRVQIHTSARTINLAPRHTTRTPNGQQLSWPVFRECARPFAALRSVGRPTRQPWQQHRRRLIRVMHASHRHQAQAAEKPARVVADLRALYVPLLRRHIVLREARACRRCVLLAAAAAARASFSRYRHSARGCAQLCICISLSERRRRPATAADRAMKRDAQRRRRGRQFQPREEIRARPPTLVLHKANICQRHNRR